MTSPLKSRRWAKWTGTTLCLLIATAWLFNLDRTAWINTPIVSIWLGDDCLDIIGPGSIQKWLRTNYGTISIQKPNHRDDVVWFRPPHIEGVLYGPNGQVDRAWFAVLPLWLPFGIFGVPTALLWISGRRHTPPGLCSSCGYNLTGANHRRCPECGKRITPARDGGSGIEADETRTRNLRRDRPAL